MKIHHVYFLVLGLSAAALAYLSHLNLAILSAGESLDVVLDAYFSYNTILTIAVPALLLGLIFLANLDYFKRGKAYLFLISALFFSSFTIVDYGIIGEAFFQFKKSHGLWRGEFSLATFMGIFWCVVVSVLTALNYVFVRIVRKYTRVPVRRKPENF